MRTFRILSLSGGNHDASPGPCPPPPETSDGHDSANQIQPTPGETASATTRRIAIYDLPVFVPPELGFASEAFDVELFASPVALELLSEEVLPLDFL